ncbi:MAG: DUF6519 domain-containing protein, partial [Methylococcales bacterium]
MYADINRKSLDPENTNFSQLLHHQGRVMLPSDLNEHGAIFQYFLRQFIMDFAGKRWRTEGSFEITEFELEKTTFKISSGHFYIDGILCVNKNDCWYSKHEPKDSVQPMFPTPEWDSIHKDNVALKKGFAVYIECWERHVNSIQRSQIREVALTGVQDTSSRLEIAWQVRVLTPGLADAYINNAVIKALNNKNAPLGNIKKILADFIDLFSVPPPAPKDHCK